MFCFSWVFLPPEEASFVITFVSLPVVGLLGPGSPDKPFGGFLESKDTCKAFELCLLAVFVICYFYFFSVSIYFSSLVHVKSVRMAILVVETLSIAACFSCFLALAKDRFFSTFTC